MKETPKQYMRRILGHVEGKDALAVQRATPGKLARMLRSLSRGRTVRKPAPGKWSIAEILAHLAEVEMVVAWRLRQAVAKSGVPVQAFDQDAWARIGRYHKRDPRQSFELFRAARQCNLTLLKNLSAAEWKRYHIHEERGKETVAHTVRMIAGHDLNHLAQIERLRRAK
jgi:uncharacterized damage-inducible protein DinB